VSRAEEWLRMGGYAAYVWPSICLALAVLGWNVWSARRAFDAARLRARRALEAAAKEES
jgi:heme exporter protein CcmD